MQVSSNHFSKKEKTSAVGSEIHFNDNAHYLQGTWGVLTIGRSCENNSVLPTVEQGVAGIALGNHLVGTRHDEERDKRVELPGEIVVCVLHLRCLVRDDQYLANDMFEIEIHPGPS